MVLGLSYGEVLVLVGASIALFGPKDIPVIARAAGRLTGKAVGYVQSAQGQLDEVMQRTQVNQVHKELQETMAQLEVIRHEIRNGMSIMRSTPMERPIYEGPRATHPTGSLHSQNGAGLMQDRIQELQEPKNVAVISEMKDLRNQTRNSVELWTSSQIVEAVVASTQEAAHGRIKAAPVGVRPSTVPNNHQEASKEITVLPISALAAGLITPRTEPLLEGADLILDSIIERKVAHQALEFLKGTDPSLT